MLSIGLTDSRAGKGIPVCYVGTVPLIDAAVAADVTIGTGTIPSSDKQAKAIKCCYKHRTH